MTVRNLEYLFRPRSIALIGASDRKGSVGATVMRNLLAGGFSGSIYPINPRHPQIANRRAFPRLADLSEVPELVVVATPAAAVPGVIAEAGALGTRAAVVLTAGSLGLKDGKGKALLRPCSTLHGPICCASWAQLRRPSRPEAGHQRELCPHRRLARQDFLRLAVGRPWLRRCSIGRSRATLGFPTSSRSETAPTSMLGMCSTISRAMPRHARDPAVHRVRYRGTQVHVRRAGRCAQQTGVVVKAGRSTEGAKAAACHTGALAGSDDVYDAAIRRAGMLRMFTYRACSMPWRRWRGHVRLNGDRLAIMTNGGGPGVMATDALIRRARHARDALRGNPAQARRHPASYLVARQSVDIIGDAPVERYAATLTTLLGEQASMRCCSSMCPPRSSRPRKSPARVHPIAKRGAGTRVLARCRLAGRGPKHLRAGRHRHLCNARGGGRRFSSARPTTAVISRR